jgi:hypothetical protein
VGSSETELVKKLSYFMEPEGSVPHSQEHATCPLSQTICLSPCMTSCNMSIFCSDNMLAPHLMPNLEDNHCLLPVTAYLNICSYPPHLKVISSIHNLKMHHAVGRGTHLSLKLSVHTVHDHIPT